MAEILEEIRISAMYNPVKLGKIYLPESDWVGVQFREIVTLFNEGETYKISDTLAVGINGEVVHFLPIPYSQGESYCFLVDRSMSLSP